MIIDKKGRLFGLINVLDILVLVMIVGLCASFLFQSVTKENMPIIGGDKKFYITFRVEKVRQFTVDAVKAGDIIYEQYAAILGTVVNVRSEESHDIARWEDGTATYFPMENKYDLLITVEANGSIRGDGYYINGNNQVSPGKDMKIQSNMVLTSVRVDDVTEELKQ